MGILPPFVIIGGGGGGGEGQNDPICLVVKEMLKTCDYIDVQHMH